jgi:uncharacterized protein YjeT (DUF2065 family)
MQHPPLLRFEAGECGRKSTVARLLAEILRCVGVVDGNFVEVRSLNEIVGEYSNQEGEKSPNILRPTRTTWSSGTRSPSWGPRSRGRWWPRGSTGNESPVSIPPAFAFVLTLIHAPRFIQDRCGFVLMIAGYEADLNQSFFRLDQGLRSRFPNRLSFHPMRPTELSELFRKLVKERRFTLAPELEGTGLVDFFRQEKAFFERQNGRGVNNLVEKAVSAMIMRTAHQDLFRREDSLRLTISEAARFDARPPTFSESSRFDARASNISAAAVFSGFDEVSTLEMGDVVNGMQALDPTQPPRQAAAPTLRRRAPKLGRQASPSSATNVTEAVAPPSSAVPVSAPRPEEERVSLLNRASVDGTEAAVVRGGGRLGPRQVAGSRRSVSRAFTRAPQAAQEVESAEGLEARLLPKAEASATETAQAKAKAREKLLTRVFGGAVSVMGVGLVALAIFLGLSLHVSWVLVVPILIGGLIFLLVGLGCLFFPEAARNLMKQCLRRCKSFAVCCGVALTAVLIVVVGALGATLYLAYKGQLTGASGQQRT